MPYCTHPWTHKHRTTHSHVCAHRHINKQTNKQDNHKHCPAGRPSNEAAQDRAADFERGATHHIRDWQDQKRVGLPRELSRRDLQPSLSPSPHVPETQENWGYKDPFPQQKHLQPVRDRGIWELHIFQLGEGMPVTHSVSILSLVFYISLPFLLISHGGFAPVCTLLS